MPSKTRTPRTSKTTRTLQPVGSQADEQANVVAFRTAAEDKLWETLHVRPNSTAAELSAAAKIGKSTAQKVLARWAADGSVVRTPGIATGGRRAADLWAINDTDAVTDDADTETNTDEEEPCLAETPQEQPAHEEHPAPGDAELTSAVDVRTAGDETTQPADVEVGNGESDTAEPVGGKAAGTVGADSGDVESNTPEEKTAQRLSPGALRGMVEDFLRDRPGEEFGPVTIARSLGGKSSGAVSNALDKLVAAGTAMKTKDAPRRYALAPAE
jgi:hypothetical protein